MRAYANVTYTRNIKQWKRKAGLPVTPVGLFRRIREEIVHIEAKIANEMYINT